MSEHSIESLVRAAEDLVLDIDLCGVKAWKAEDPRRRVIGHLPVVAPLELITAAGMHPVGIIGAGDTLEIIKGDAYFQSYICHLPRSVVELGVGGKLDVCDGFLFPSTCDVIRNLSGMWQLLFPGKAVRYIDVPQDRRPSLGGKWYANELREVRAMLDRIGGRAVTDDDLWRAIDLHDQNRLALRELYDLRAAAPWQAPASEVYAIQRAGYSLRVEEHTAMIRDYLRLAAASARKQQDLCRVVLAGAFCEQPPLGLIKTLERAGCAIVDDDFLLGPRFARAPVNTAPRRRLDPIAALVDAFFECGTPTATIYLEEGEKGDALAATCRERDADGLIFCAPSFCDPALLDQPMLVAAMDRHGISHTSFKYSENTGQFQTIREQAGTFADSLRLWSEA